MKLHQRFGKWISRIGAFYKKSDRFSMFDWVLFLLLAGFCFVSYVHVDLVHTGNRSWILYEGIGSFYDNVMEWSKDYGANYMPSTFWMFALWNLPLKLLGVKTPDSLGDFRIRLTLWYKLLPLLLFVGSVWMIYLVGKEIGLGRHKAKIAMFAYMTMPVCFFSQFIFAQCDIFTVFFMLWGMYYYYRNQEHDMWRFALLFGLAVTFKYFALVIFFVLLLVREKKVRRILAYSAAMALPFGMEYLLYRGSVGFQRGVFGFRALSFVSSTDLVTELGTVSYTKVGCILLVLWAYLVKAKSRREETAWTLYLCCGVWFAIFGFSVWHPQWLMIMAPFWVLSAFISVHQEKFLWIDAGLAVILHFLCSSAYQGSVDANLLAHLVWKKVFHTDTLWYYISDVWPKIDRNTTYSAFVAVLLVLFLFKHPRYACEDFAREDVTDHMHLIRLRLVLVVGMFSVPAFLAAYVNTISPETALTNMEAVTGWVELTKDTVICQELPEAAGRLKRISFYSNHYGRNNTADVTIEISDEEGKSVYSHTLAPEEISASNYTEHELEQEVLLKKEHSYTVSLSSTDGTEGNAFGAGIAEGPNALGLGCVINGNATECTAGIYYISEYDDWKAARVDN